MSRCLRLCSAAVISAVFLFVSVFSVPVMTDRGSYAAEKVSLNKTSFTMGCGEKYKLKLKNAPGPVTWGVSDSSIAEVDGGVVSAKKKAGKVIVAATCEGEKYTCKITVQKGKLSVTSKSLLFNQSYKIGTSINTKVSKWYSTNKKIATVSSKGNVKAVTQKGGVCYICAVIKGKTYKCKIGVKKKGVYLRVTPNTKPIGGKYMNTGVYNKYTKHSLMLRTCMSVLEKRGGGVLVLTKGTYNIVGVLFVPSNVTVKLENNVKVCKKKKSGTKHFPSKFSIFCVVKPSVVTAVTKDKAKYMKAHNGEEDEHFRYKHAVKAYNGSKNVTFKGNKGGNAVIDHKGYYYTFGISMGHAKNITVQDINFRNMDGNHYVEINSSNGVLVQRCYFKNDVTTYGYNKEKRVYKYNNKWVDGLDHAKVAHKEAINIDTCDPNIKGYNNPWAYHDYTPCKNITVRNCTFRRIVRCVGSHKYTAKKGSKGKWDKQVYNENIKVYNNEMYQTGCNCVTTCNWKKVLIKNNIMDVVTEKCSDVPDPWGEYKDFFSNLRPASKADKVEVDSSLKLKTAILVAGSQNVKITGNRISNCYLGVAMFNLMNMEGGYWYAMSKYSLTKENRDYVINSNYYTNMSSGCAYFFANDKGSVVKGFPISTKKQEYFKDAEQGRDWDAALRKYMKSSSYKKPKHFNEETEEKEVKKEAQESVPAAENEEEAVQ